MNKLILSATFVLIFTSLSYSQHSIRQINPSYRYVANPGFVNITEINGATGLGDVTFKNSKYYFGISNIFGYQINRNIIGGAGIGCYFYDSGQLIPLFLETRYNIYLKRVAPYFYNDCGAMVDLVELRGGSKIFINPGVGISRSLSSKFEANFAVGLMVQMGINVPSTSFINFKLGILFRKNSYRLYKPHDVNSF
jgi:hypothetical protein